MTAAGSLPEPMARPAATSALCAWKPPIRSRRTLWVLAAPGEQQLLPGGVEALAEQPQVAALGAADGDAPAGPRALAMRRTRGPCGSSRLTTAVPRLGSTRSKSPSLACEVGLEVGVIVEVVAGDVGEAGRGQADAVEPELVEAVARGLHRGVGDALVGEVGEQAVQRDRLGRGVGERRATAPSTPTVPKFTAVSPSALPDLAGEARDRGLAVGAGDRDHHLGLVAVPAAGGDGERAARLVVQDHRHAQRAAPGLGAARPAGSVSTAAAPMRSA